METKGDVFFHHTEMAGPIRRKRSFRFFGHLSHERSLINITFIKAMYTQNIKTNEFDQWVYISTHGAQGDKHRNGPIVFFFAKQRERQVMSVICCCEQNESRTIVISTMKMWIKVNESVHNFFSFFK